MKLDCKIDFFSIFSSWKIIHVIICNLLRRPWRVSILKEYDFNPSGKRTINSLPITVISFPKSEIVVIPERKVVYLVD